MRGDKVFADQGCDRVLIDIDKKREALSDLLGGLLRLDAGDVIVVYSASDLGNGPALKRVREHLEAQDVKIEVFGRPIEPKQKPAQSRGIPYAAQVIAQPYWHLPGISIEFINDLLRREGEKVKETWGPYARHQFIYVFGNQGAEPRTLSPPTGAPLKDTEE